MYATYLRQSVKTIIEKLPHLAKIDKKKILPKDEWLSVLTYQQEDDAGFCTDIQVESDRHAQVLRDDITVTKVYRQLEFENDDNLLMAFIDLGIRYLEEKSESDSVEIGRKLLGRLITNSRELVYISTHMDFKL